MVCSLRDWTPASTALPSEGGQRDRQTCFARLAGWLVRLAPMGYASRGIGVVVGVGVDDDYYDDDSPPHAHGGHPQLNLFGWSFDPRRGVDIIRTKNIKRESLRPASLSLYPCTQVIRIIYWASVKTYLAQWYSRCENAVRFQFLILLSSLASVFDTRNCSLDGKWMY